jgi:hypothetical protein
MVQRRSLRRNIYLLFLFEDVNEKEEGGEKKGDKLKDRYWFHPVQIESSPMPSSIDFKGL